MRTNGTTIKSDTVFRKNKIVGNIISKIIYQNGCAPTCNIFKSLQGNKLQKIEIKKFDKLINRLFH